jgi:hypothetical protein
VVPVARNSRAPRSAREVGRQRTHVLSRLNYLEPLPGYRWPCTLGGKQMQGTAPAPGTEHGPVALPRTGPGGHTSILRNRESCRPESLLVPPLPAATPCGKGGTEDSQSHSTTLAPRTPCALAPSRGPLPPTASRPGPGQACRRANPAPLACPEATTSAPTIARPCPCPRPPPLRCAWPARAWPEW